jgi:hypothetical protein
MTDRQQVETTYADLRPDDLVVDKAGNAWPIAAPDESSNYVTFFLCDPVTKVPMHPMRKLAIDPVTVSRILSHAYEAAKLEAEFPGTDPDTFVNIVEALEAVETIADPEPMVEYSATEFDAANTATDDSPVRLPAFDTLTPLEARSHLYLLHGIFAADLKGRDELAGMHAEAHRQHADGSLKSAYVPHVHEAA